MLKNIIKFVHGNEKILQKIDTICMLDIVVEHLRIEIAGKIFLCEPNAGDFWNEYYNLTIPKKYG